MTKTRNRMTCSQCFSECESIAKFCSGCGMALDVALVVPKQRTGGFDSAGQFAAPSNQGGPPATPRPAIARPPKRRRWPIALAAVVIASVTTAGVVAAISLRGPSTDSAYLKALRAKGEAGKFASDAGAIAHAKHVCSALEAGGAQQGRTVDLTGVRFYCPQFVQGFHVLKTVTVRGSFELDDTGWLGNEFASSSIATLGGSCYGTDGYDDIGPGTQVVVTNASGRVLSTTGLGSGQGTDTSCTFRFAFRVTEGQSDYRISVSHRGTQDFTFTQLRDNGVSLSLGS
jgi:hypothetical protein